MGTGSFPGIKCGRGVLLTTHPLLQPRSWKSRAIPLPTLWAHRTCNGNSLTLPSYIYIYIMGTGSFPGVKCGRGVLLTTHPLLQPRSWKSRSIPLPNLWATPGL